MLSGHLHTLAVRWVRVRDSDFFHTHCAGQGTGQELATGDVETHSMQVGRGDTQGGPCKEPAPGVQFWVLQEATSQRSSSKPLAASLTSF